MYSRHDRGGENKTDDVCRFHNTKDGCKKQNCRFIHRQLTSSCKFFWHTDEGCRYGTDCFYSHQGTRCRGDCGLAHKYSPLTQHRMKRTHSPYKPETYSMRRDDSYLEETSYKSFKRSRADSFDSKNDRRYRKPNERGGGDYEIKKQNSKSGRIEKRQDTRKNLQEDFHVQTSCGSTYKCIVDEFVRSDMNSDSLVEKTEKHRSRHAKFSSQRISEKSSRQEVSATSKSSGKQESRKRNVSNYDMNNNTVSSLNKGSKKSGRSLKEAVEKLEETGKCQFIKGKEVTCGSCGICLPIGESTARRVLQKHYMENIHSESHAQYFDELGIRESFGWGNSKWEATCQACGDNFIDMGLMLIHVGAKLMNHHNAAYRNHKEYANKLVTCFVERDLGFIETDEELIFWLTALISNDNSVSKEETALKNSLYRQKGEILKKFKSNPATTENAKISDAKRRHENRKSTDESKKEKRRQEVICQTYSDCTEFSLSNDQHQAKDIDSEAEKNNSPVQIIKIQEPESNETTNDENDGSNLEVADEIEISDSQGWDMKMLEGKNESSDDESTDLSVDDDESEVELDYLDGQNDKDSDDGWETEDSNAVGSDNEWVFDDDSHDPAYYWEKWAMSQKDKSDNSDSERDSGRMGFTGDEWNELMSQGIKPWEDDDYDLAWGLKIRGYI